MSDPIPEEVREIVPPDAVRLLIEQIRIAFWNILIITVGFAVGDLIFSSRGGESLLLVNLAVVALTAAGLVGIRQTAVQARPVPFAVLMITAIDLAVAAAGIVRHDATEPPLLIVVFTLGVGGIFAWDVAPQLAVAIAASVAIAWNVHAVNGRFGTFGHDAIFTAIVALLLSVWMTHRRKLFRVEATRQNQQRQRDEARRAGEERFAALVQSSADVVIIEDDNAVPRYVSPAVQQVLGYPPEALVGTPTFRLIHPEDLPRVRALFDAAVREPGASVSTEFRAHHANGSWVYLDTIATNLLHHPQIRGMVMHARDITDRKRAEDEKNTLLDIAHDISGTLDLAEMLDRVHRRLSALLPCERVATFLWDPARERFRMVSQHGVPAHLLPEALALEFRIGQPVAAQLGEQQPLIINDVTAQPWVAVDVLRRLEIEAVVGVPLVVHGHLVGALTASRTAAQQPFTDREVRLFDGIARHVAVAIDTVELYRTQQADAAVASALARIAHELISALNTPELLSRLCRLTAEVLGCDVSHTYLWQDAAHAYVPVAGHGDTPEQWETLAALQVPRDAMEPLLERFQRDEPVQLLLTQTRDVVSTALRRYYRMTFAVYMALRRGGEIFGVHAALYRGRRESLDRTQERIARGMVQLASMALENARLVEELERANHFNSDFIASMSHELRTPINVMVGYHELLLAGTFDPLTADQADAVRRADRSARELLALVNATLDLSRFEAQPTPVVAEDVAVRGFIDELARETRQQPTKPGVALRWAVAPDLPGLRTDPLKLKMVLKNLVGNALKFTHEGQVIVEAQQLDGGVQFRVSDTGIGIAPDAQAMIFEPFHQVASANDHDYGGVGLGLYIVRRLLDMVGGRIDVHSAPGAGSTFTVWIPSTPPSPPGN